MIYVGPFIKVELQQEEIKYQDRACRNVSCTNKKSYQNRPDVKYCFICGCTVDSTTMYKTVQTFKYSDVPNNLTSVCVSLDKYMILIPNDDRDPPREFHMNDEYEGFEDLFDKHAELDWFTTAFAPEIELLTKKVGKYLQISWGVVHWY